jgi:predicted metal-dependent hydrolase
VVPEGPPARDQGCQAEAPEVTERSAVQWGTTKIPYEIRRSSRRATVSLTIDPKAGLLVTAPGTTPVPRLDAVVRTKAKWVVERLKRISDVPPALPGREFVSGETFLYLGRPVRLRVLQDGAPAPIRLHRGWLELPIPRGLDAVHRGRYARAALIDWYRRLAARRLPRLVEAWAVKADLTFKNVVVTEQATRWGSCSDGNLRLNWRIMQAPQSLLDYVVAHEVVHLAHEHHGPTFWGALGRLMPDYETRRARLKELGPRLLW